MLKTWQARHLRRLADFPLSVLVDWDGAEWTWCEARTYAMALRGRVEGLGSVPSWGEPSDWRPTAQLAFADDRPRSTRVYPRDALVRWAGEPWVPPERPCPHCRGTGVEKGTAADRARPGAIRSGVLVDLNLLARVLSVIPDGPVVVDAIPGSHVEDAVRLRALGGDVRAVLARMRGHTEGLEPFEAWYDAQGVQTTLDGSERPWRPSGGRPASEPPTEPDLTRLDATHAVQALDGPGDLLCPACGGQIRAGQCAKCGKIRRGSG